MQIQTSTSASQIGVSLVNISSYFLNQVLSPATVSSYTTACTAFLSLASITSSTFLCQHLPMVDENILIMFVTHCATSLGLSYSTIKQSLNGIRYHCVKLTGFNPLLTSTEVTLNKLQLVMRGIRKTEVKFNRQVRMPVTSFVLGRLINLLNGGVFGPSSAITVCLKPMKCANFAARSQLF